MRYRLRSTTVQAVRWHGDYMKIDPFSEIEKAFGVTEPIHRQLGGVISVSDETSPDGYTNSVRVEPGQWIIRGLMDRTIVMDDDLFEGLFKPVKD